MATTKSKKKEVTTPRFELDPPRSQRENANHYTMLSFLCEQHSMSRFMSSQVTKRY